MTMTAEVETWEDQATCRQPWVKMEWFFKTDPSDDAEDEAKEFAFAYNRTREDYARAKLVCADCPVARECLLTNLDAEFGVFGGYDEDEREAIREGRAVPHRRPVPVLPEKTKMILDVFRYGTSVVDTREVLNLHPSYNVVGLARTQHTLRLRTSDQAHTPSGEVATA